MYHGIVFSQLFFIVISINLTSRMRSSLPICLDPFVTPAVVYSQAFGSGELLILAVAPEERVGNGELRGWFGA